MNRTAAAILLAAPIALAACAAHAPLVAAPHEKIGTPYQVAGVTYTPAADDRYDAVGIASWYGRQFDGKRTANGEIFDMNDLSAAHKTLPLPSIVEVTNLQNGRSIRVRLNDRGPFKNNRIIDLSRAAAVELGFFEAGLAEVRVRYVGPAYLDGGLDVVQKSWPTPSLAPQRLGAAPAARIVAQPAVYRAPVADGAPYFIQLAAVSSKSAADALLAGAADIATGFVEPVTTGEGALLHRVRIGPIIGEAAARAALDRTKAAGYDAARLVRTST
ncbi:MAG: septal ring lytic transglycosylase RlpA family protein [Pseudomonadota bacterium]